VETLAGYLLDEFGRVPATGESIERGALRFEVAAVDDQRITSVRIVRIGPPTPEEAELVDDGS